MPKSRRAHARGRIALPEIEIVTLDPRGEPSRVDRLRAPGRGPLARLVLRGRDRFELIGGKQVPTELLPAQQSWTLLEVVVVSDGSFGEQVRCVLHVLPGMQGEVAIGVSRMTLAQVLADPALREPDGSARLPLPHGARLRITWGPLSLAARIGGPPLTPPPTARPQFSPCGADEDDFGSVLAPDPITS